MSVRGAVGRLVSVLAAIILIAHCLQLPLAAQELQQPLAAPELMKMESLTIVTSSTATTLTAEVADTPFTRERGLMFRHILPPEQVMLFDFGESQPVSMWMKNTYMSLDMLFVRQDGSIAALAENTVPQSLDIVGVQEPVRGVVEMAAGTVKRLGIRKNDQVVNRIFSNTLN